MKAQTKMIAASLVVIMLALSAVGGVTYSWFSDSEEAEITITTGSISISAEITGGTFSDLSTKYTYDATSNKIGPVTITKDNDGNEAITINNLAGGTNLKLEYKITITSSFDFVYVPTYNVESPSGLASPFTITGMDKQNGSASSSPFVIDEVIEIDVGSMGNEYMGKSFKITLSFNAYQANTPESDLPQSFVSSVEKQKIDSSEERTITSINVEDEKTQSVSLTIPANSFSGTRDISVTALSEVAPKDTSYIVMMTAQNGEILGGIDVDLDGATLSKDAKVCIIIDGIYEPANLAIYHKGEKVTADFEVTYENENTVVSFNAKDFSAYYVVKEPCVWDGKVPTEMPETLVVDGGNCIVYVKDAAAFAYLSTLSEKWADLYTDGNGRTYTNYANGTGVNYYYSDKWTVSLEVDIDLNNHEIDPVSVVIGESTGSSTFNGNNHVIRNINTGTGLFANDNRITYADLSLENVKATNGALTGSSLTSISNVAVKGATISGVDYVGGLVGYMYGNVTGCKVIDSSVTATGKEAGGLIGYIASSTGDGKVTGNEVLDVSITAGNRAGGLVAQVNVGVKVYDNSVENVTITAEDISTYLPGAVVSNALEPKNVHDNKVTNVITLTPVSTADDLVAALEKGCGVRFKDDISINPASMSNAYGTTGINVKNGQTIDGNGHTLDIKGAGGTWDSGINTTGGLIKDLTVRGSFRGIFINHNSTHSEPVILENVIIDGTTYTISCDQGKNQRFEAYDSTFKGWTSYAATTGDTKFVNCYFGEGSGYAFCRPYAPTEFVGCEFEAGFKLDPRAAVTFENCTLYKFALTKDNIAELVTSNIANATVK